MSVANFEWFPTGGGIPASATASGSGFVTLATVTLGGGVAENWLVKIRCLAWTGYTAATVAAAELDIIISYDGTNAHVGSTVSASYTGTAELNVTASANVVTFQAGGITNAAYSMMISAEVQAP